jgi:hypothetical protein
MPAVLWIDGADFTHQKSTMKLNHSNDESLSLLCIRLSGLTSKARATRRTEFALQLFPPRIAVIVERETAALADKAATPIS